MTERLYYKNSDILEFDAKVVENGTNDEKHFVILDRTAFYPTSGGQPHDIGSINEIEVIDVSEDHNGNIRHILKKEISATSVHGIIDPNRRKYFRQLHTAQHVLSRAFIELFEFETVSVHLGEDYGAIELTNSSVTDEQSKQAETLANQIIENNLSVEIIFAEKDEAIKLPLRKKPEREGTIRIIKIGELDWSACGGTHCNFTSEIGIIKIIAVEKQRGNALIKFLAGKKAKEDYDLRFEISDALTKTLTCSVTDIPDKFQKLTDENKQLKKQLSQLQSELLPMKVEELKASAEQSGNYKIVMQQVSDIDPKLLNQLASETAQKIKGLVALLFENRLCIATSDNIALDSGQIVKQMSVKLDLKGGGGKTLAQLGGVKAEDLNLYRETILAIINE